MCYHYTIATMLFWSGQRESDPQLHLGRVAYYRYTMPAT